MGYVINSSQVKAFKELLDKEDLTTDVELLWLPWHMEVKLWQPNGHTKNYGIDLHGQVIDESESNYAGD